MKKVLLFLFIGMTASALVGCKKTIDDYPAANLRAIAAFGFDYYHNAQSNIFIKHEGVIDETNRRVTVSVPTDADLAHLKPTISLSPWTTSKPGNLEEVDFSHGPVEYEVCAQSGKKAYYQVEVTADFVYSDAKMYRLYLSDIPRDTTDIEDFDPEDPTFGMCASPNDYVDKSALRILLPYGSTYDLSSQRTHLDMSASSHNCTIDVSELGDESDYKPFHDNDAINYTRDSVIFRVTAMSGKAVRYFVTVHVKTEE